MTFKGRAEEGEGKYTVHTSQGISVRTEGLVSAKVLGYEHAQHSRGQLSFKGPSVKVREIVGRHG